VASLTLMREPSSAFVRARDYCSRGLPWVSKGSLALLDQGLISGSNFAIGILLARWLVPQQFGAYALAFSIFLFLYGFHDALLLEPMSVLGPTTYAKCLPAYLGKLIKLHFVLALSFSGLVAAGIAVLHYFTSDPALPSALWGVALVTPLILFFWLCRRATYLRLAPAMAVGGASAYFVVAMGLLFLIKTLGHLSTFTAFFIQSLAATVAACLLLASLRPQLDSRSGPTTSEVVREHWRYGRWVVGTQFVYWLSGSAYYLISAAFLRMQDVAALRALQNFTSPFAQFITAVSLLLLPWSSARFAEEGPVLFRRRIRQITLLFVAVASGYYAALWLFGEKLIRIFYAGRYTEYAHLLPLLAAPVLVLAVAQGNSIAVQAMQSPSNVLFAYSIAGATTVALGVPLTRHWGLPGAAVGILISYLAYFITISLRCQARLRQGQAVRTGAGT